MRILSMPLHKPAAHERLLAGVAFDGHPAAAAAGSPLARTPTLAAHDDEAMMARCIELARLAVADGEYPFGLVIALDGEIVAEAVNTDDPRRRCDPPRRDRSAEPSATDDRPGGAAPGHALFQHRALRDVRLLHS
jgi:hypothetical protein